MKCGAGTPIAWRIAANESEPLPSLAKPCSMNPYPTIRRSGIGAQRGEGNRRRKSSEMRNNIVLYSSSCCKVFTLGHLRKAAEPDGTGRASHPAPLIRPLVRFYFTRRKTFSRRHSARRANLIRTATHSLHQTRRTFPQL